MKVNSITSLNNTKNVAFSGVVDKSVAKYIQKTTDILVGEKLSYSNYLAIPIDKDYLISTKNVADTVLSKLESYMSHLHPKTILKIKDSTVAEKSDIWMENTGTKLPIIANYKSKVDNAIHLFGLRFLYPIYSPEFRLSAINRFANELDKIKPEKIDDAIYSLKLDATKDAIEKFYNKTGFFNFEFLMNNKINNFLDYTAELSSKDKPKEVISQFITDAIEKAKNKALDEQIKNKIREENTKFTSDFFSKK